MESSTAFILILLGLVFKFPAALTANTTKTYYVTLTIEHEAFAKFKELLENITVLNDKNYTATVSHINITTDCHTSDTFMNCTCANGNRWNDDILNKYPNCLTQAYCTIQQPKRMVMCQSVNRVLVNGSFIIQDPEINIDSGKESYENVYENLTHVLTSIYSTLDWFDSLNITRLRQGSIIGDFVISVNNKFSTQTIENLTTKLESEIMATVNLVTIGLIEISHQELIGSNETVNITCTPQDKLGNVMWFIQRLGVDKQAITNGRESTVQQLTSHSTLQINNTSEFWKGTLTCDFTSKSLRSIIHRASVYLDVAILPQIFVSSEPQFPNCKNITAVVPVKIMCYINNSTETYTITWTGAKGSAGLKYEGMKTVYYEAWETIRCKDQKETHDVECMFKNRKNQTTSANLKIPIITSNSIFCKADDSWPAAKANFTTIKSCESFEDGLYERKCDENGRYGKIVSKCVNEKLRGLLDTAMDFQRGIGHVAEGAINVFTSLKKSTETITTTFANINASVDIMDKMQNASEIQKSKWNDTILDAFVTSSSNLLNKSLLDAWNQFDSLGLTFLKTIEKVLNQTNVISSDLNITRQNVAVCYVSVNNQSCNNTFNVSVNKSSSQILQMSINNLDELLPKTLHKQDIVSNGVILSLVPLHNNTSNTVSMQFPNNRSSNHDMYCVYFNVTTSEWSNDGCKWGGVHNPYHCECNHFTAFAILMSKMPIQLDYLNELTATGLGFSVFSLALCLIIEFLVWNTVVKSNISHFRHTVMVNIELCLLIAHCSFLAHIYNTPVNRWCLVLTILKHFFFLAVFFWMMCLSMGLLHQVVLVFVHLRKKVYLGLCFSIGYVCPLIIVTATIITYDNGNNGSYYIQETCWLKYEKLLQGSIHSFVLPVGVIVFVNMFTMVLVISKILKPTMSELKSHDDKEIVRSIIKSVVVLTPILGTTWVLGFFVLMLDLTEKPWAQIANYAFTFFNSFQGFFILLTGCLGEKKVRDALVLRFRQKRSSKMKNESLSSGSKGAAGKRK